MRSTSARRGSARCPPCNFASSHPAHPPGRPALSMAPRVFSPALPAILPLFLSALLRQPRHAHRQPGFHHLKLAPRQLHVACGEGKIVAVTPLRLDHLPRSQRQQLAHAKLAHRNGHAQFHRQLRNRCAENGRCLALQRRRRRNQSLKSLCGSSALRRRCTRMWCPRRCRQWMCSRHSGRSSSSKRTRGRWNGLEWFKNCAAAWSHSDLRSRQSASLLH
jgi:hypothetical protein